MLFIASAAEYASQSEKHGSGGTSQYDQKPQIIACRLCVTDGSVRSEKCLIQGSDNRTVTPLPATWKPLLYVL
jgi:hypothetical protein